MDIRRITDNYSVSPQIAPEDVAELKAQGFTAVICNRPDAENPPGQKAADIRAAAEAAGLAFHDIPFAHGSLSLDLVEAQRRVQDETGGPVLAYCASGNRCSVLWALSQAADIPTDDILQATGRAGYDLTGLRPQIEALASR